MQKIRQPVKTASGKQKPVHHGLAGIHKVAVFVLLAFIASQSFIIFNVADAGDLTAQSLLECTNKIRLQYQKNNLVINEELNKAAQNKLEDMIAYGYWAHENPQTRRKPWDFIDAAGYYYQTSGENLAIGFEDSQAICDAWAKSPTHLANIKDATFQEVGFAVNKANLHKNGNGILVVQMFGSRKDFGAKKIESPVVATGDSSEITPRVLSVKNTAPATATLAHPARDGIKAGLKHFMPYVIVLLYLLTFLSVIYRATLIRRSAGNTARGAKKTAHRAGKVHTPRLEPAILGLALSSFFSSIIYLVLT